MKTVLLRLLYGISICLCTFVLLHAYNDAWDGHWGFVIVDLALALYWAGCIHLSREVLK